ncbi:MAG TPA: CPBP family intramembrane glutamic endopeptidase [Thermoplasmata archaeon]|nr:CPBP family intramembrane glutamic endopeptidase [Thermoplasmata archaeon]
MAGGDGRPAGGPPPSVARYAIGVIVLVGAIASQYVLPQHVAAFRAVYGTLVGDVAVVYLLPVLVFALLVGAGPLRGWRAHFAIAVPRGLGWYGVLSLLALVVLFVSALVYLAVDPGALRLLDRPNPALEAARGDPWFFVGFSFVVGAFEETLFRGWVFGYWLARRTPWLLPALLSSALFAAVHLYYGTTYGAAAPLVFPTLFLIGFAFAATYRDAGGNLVVPALLHGANDAAAYLTLVSLLAGEALHWTVVLVGALVMLVLWALRPRGALPAPALPS